jgi:2-dehydro-3-deoxy-D-arabinonate dehydratase
MKYYQTADGLVVRNEPDTYRPNGPSTEVDDFQDLLRNANQEGKSPDEYVNERFDTAETQSESFLTNLEDPVLAEEIWAAGVTYEISEKAREKESGLPDIYLDAYEADRPELFFKADSRRTVGPEEPVGIRKDSDWDVPEPELGIVLYRDEIVGYTIGNDMSSRSIEGKNPLYLPQAKVYDRCCAIGPCVVSSDSISDPMDLAVEMAIKRNGTTCFSGETSTNKIVRSCNELVGYLTRHNTLPEVCVLLTGTSIVPDEDFTLRQGDLIEISIESIGTLRNPVTVV